MIWEFLIAMFRANISLHSSISFKNSLSTSDVPFFPVFSSINLSKLPVKTASFEKTLAISSHFSM
ncbi:MAG: hypothetical protein FWH54_05625 [Methanobrevibacter sp.]|nr:hypothetical protein [Methanobrevibacter sp.]